MRTLLLTCCLLVLYACQSPLHYNQSPLFYDGYDYGDEFELSLGEKVTVGRDNASVEFIDVLEDSRCPSNVTCVWAGNGKVQLRFDNKDIQLNTYLDLQEVSLEDVNIQLLSLDPYPEYPHQFEKEDYKIRLLITKK